MESLGTGGERGRRGRKGRKGQEEAGRKQEGAGRGRKKQEETGRGFPPSCPRSQRFHRWSPAFIAAPQLLKAPF